MSLPGPWIDDTDRDYAGTVYHLLSSAASQFNDAVVARQFFEPIDRDDVKRDASGEVFAWTDPVRDRLRGIGARAYVYAWHNLRRWAVCGGGDFGAVPGTFPLCAS